MLILKRIKKWYSNFIETLAKENEKSFGNGKLDCCELNKGNNIKK